MKQSYYTMKRDLGIWGKQILEREGEMCLFILFSFFTSRKQACVVIRYWSMRAQFFHVTA